MSLFNTKSAATLIAAINESVKHWERLLDPVQFPNEHTGGGQCALCGLFFSVRNNGRFTSNDCVGCPVAQKTGQKYCEGSPYRAAAEYIYCYPCDKHSSVCEREARGTEEFKKLALAELKFLKSL
jgi:hypothetical protein